MSTVCILGAGALGSLWAARLSNTHTVKIIPRLNKKSSLSGYDFSLQDAETTTTYHLPYLPLSSLPDGTLSENTRSSSPSVILLVFCKSFDTLPALTAIKPYLPHRIPIVLFQNGLGSQVEVGKAFPDHPVYAAVTTEGANRKTPQHIIHAGRGSTWIGPFNKQATMAGAKEACAVLADSGLEVSAEADITLRLWKKLAVNCAINPMTALLNCPNGELPCQPYFTARYTTLCKELVLIMQLTIGYETTSDALKAQIDEVIRKTAQNISSMLQDLRAGRKTEIEDICGYLVKEARQQNIACPTITQLYQDVLALATTGSQ